MSEDRRAVNDRDASPVPRPPVKPAPAPPTRKARAWKFTVHAMGCLIGVAVALSPGFHVDTAQWLAVAFFLVPALWFHTLLHEAGHAVAGVACGMRALAFGIGPFRVERGLSGWYWRHGGAIRGLGGFAMLVPSPVHGPRRLDTACLLLGGPLANLLVAALGFAVWRSTAEPSLLRSFWLAMIACGTFFGVLNLVPFTVHGWRNDGRQLLDLLLDRAQARLALRMQAAAGLGYAGVRPRDWPATLTSLPVPEQQGMLRTNALLLQIAWASDSGDATRRADAALRLADDFWQAPPAMRPHVALAMAGHAIRAGDGDAARAWRPLCDGGVLYLGADRRWVDAALALHAGDVDEARVQLAFARIEVAKVHNAAAALVLGELLDELQQRIDRAQLRA